MPRSKAQKLAKKADRLRKREIALARCEQRDKGPVVLSFQNLIADYEKGKQEAIARALDGVSLDPRQCRRAFGPPPAPGYTTATALSLKCCINLICSANS